MCELCLPRRAVLAGAGAIVIGAGTGVRWNGVAAATVRQDGAPPIVPRAQWGPHLPPVGEIPDEPDVRFLLVHHTVNANDYGAEQVVDLLAGMYGFHTSPEKGWPDIAYNFLIDRFGTIYEGRTGSLAGAKAADATGGSQGFAQLCSFIGDHRTEPPSEAALASMVAMLAFLGDRHGIDLSPGATATFVSRGSNLRPAGQEVTTPTISGHRDMSTTVCPGDAAYALVADGTFANLATAARSVPPAPTTTTTTTPPSSTTAPPTTASSTSTSTSTSAATPATGTSVPPATGNGSAGDDGTAASGPLVAAGLAAAAAAMVALRRRGQG